MQKIQRDQQIPAIKHSLCNDTYDWYLTNANITLRYQRKAHFTTLKGTREPACFITHMSDKVNLSMSLKIDLLRLSIVIRGGIRRGIKQKEVKLQTGRKRDDLEKTKSKTERQKAGKVVCNTFLHKHIRG